MSDKTKQLEHYRRQQMELERQRQDAEIHSIIEKFDDTDRERAGECADYMRKRVKIAAVMDLFVGIAGVDDEAVTMVLSDCDTEIALDTAIDEVIVSIANAEIALAIFREKHRNEAA